MFKNVFSLSGRISRSEYLFTLIIIGFSNALLGEWLFPTMRVLLDMCLQQYEQLLWIVNLLLSISFLGCWGMLTWILICQAVKRSHDVGRSGWFILLPIYNPFWLIFAEGEWENRYGEKE